MRRFHNCLAASTAVTNNARSAGPIETCRVPPALKSTLGEVGGSEQAEPDGDEEDSEKGEIRRRQPQLVTWQQAGHPKQL